MPVDARPRPGRRPASPPPTLEADGDGLSVAVDDELDAVGEVDGVAVVELGGERRRTGRPALSRSASSTACQ